MVVNFENLIHEDQVESTLGALSERKEDGC